MDLRYETITFVRFATALCALCSHGSREEQHLNTMQPAAPQDDLLFIPFHRRFATGQL